MGGLHLGYEGWGEPLLKQRSEVYLREIVSDAPPPLGPAAEALVGVPIE